MIKLISDVHLEHHKPLDIINSQEYDDSILIIAGDLNAGMNRIIQSITLLCKKYKHVVYIPGNHEYYTYSIAQINHALAELSIKNITTVDTNGYIDSVVFGKRIVGCVGWGALNRNEYAIQSGVKDFQRIINADNSDYVTVAELKQQHDNDMNFLRSALQTPCDIVVTHHVPFNFLVRPEFQNSVLQPAYVMECDEMFHDYSVQYPEYWLFGHTHDKIVVDRGDVKFRCNPMGYTTEHGFSPIII